jgi:diphosphomevalonate decarboxylase
MIMENSAPSNIALIKYMGKVDSTANLPANSSMSFTLDQLRTFVRLTLREDLTTDQWLPLTGPGLHELSLNEKSKTRFIKHFQMLKKEWKIEKCFLIESANNFASDCGLASSASSFAALTKTAVELFQKISPRTVGIQEIAEYSRKGSGSSCRSLFAPFALWQGKEVHQLEFPIKNIFHQAIVVESEKKAVSSSEAHLRVTSSPLFAGRPERAERRLEQLTQVFRNENWKLAYEICWSEFWDMHALFETSQPAFGYMQPKSIEVLQDLRNFWQRENDGPIVTMDAGANIHLLWRGDQNKMAEGLRGRYDV